MEELLKVKKLVENTVLMYKKYADSAKESEDKQYYEGALEAATNIYDYVDSVVRRLELNGQSSK